MKHLVGEHPVMAQVPGSGLRIEADGDVSALVLVARIDGFARAGPDLERDRGHGKSSVIGGQRVGCPADPMENIPRLLCHLGCDHNGDLGAADGEHLVRDGRENGQE